MNFPESPHRTITNLKKTNIRKYICTYNYTYDDKNLFLLGRYSNQVRNIFNSMMKIISRTASNRAIPIYKFIMLHCYDF